MRVDVRRPRLIEAVFTLVTASTFLHDVKKWSGPFFDAHQLGARLKFDVDIKILLNFDVDCTNVKTFCAGVRQEPRHAHCLNVWGGLFQMVLIHLVVESLTFCPFRHLSKELTENDAVTFGERTVSPGWAWEVLTDLIKDQLLTVCHVLGVEMIEQEDAHIFAVTPFAKYDQITFGHLQSTSGLVQA